MAISRYCETDLKMERLNLEECGDNIYLEDVMMISCPVAGKF
jgi:hypothetical protein